jgi:hypothetical protein
MDNIQKLIDLLSENTELNAKHVNAWVQEFLRGEGDNSTLADTLLRYGDFVVGQREYPLDEVVNILGPTKEYKFYEEASVLKERIDKMVSSIRCGWEPAPLILTNIWEDYLELADGGHRHRALIKAGHTTHPVIIYFRDQQTKDKFISTDSVTK